MYSSNNSTFLCLVSVSDAKLQLIAQLEAMFVQDVIDNRAIGEHGARAILDDNNGNAKGDDNKINILTHCNTGSLATAGYGTALGVCRAIHARNRINKVHKQDFMLELL